MESKFDCLVCKSEELACGECFKRLLNENKHMRQALEEIAIGQGPFSIDQLKHASNTIEAMKDLAKAALEGSKW